MVPEITQAFSEIKIFADLAMMVQKQKVDAAVRDKAIEAQSATIALQSAILSLQGQYAELMMKKEELERRLIEIENWAGEVQRYQLKEIDIGVFVRELTQDQAEAEPIHWLCTNCFAHRRKSILQRHKQDYACPRCDFTIYGHSDCVEQPSPVVGRRYSLF
jgi:hypothetical protein